MLLLLLRQLLPRLALTRPPVLHASAALLPSVLQRLPAGEATLYSRWVSVRLLPKAVTAVAAAAARPELPLDREPALLDDWLVLLVLFDDAL